MAYSYIDFGVGTAPLTSAEQGGVFAPTGLNYVQSDDIYVTVTQTATAVITALTTSQFTVVTTPTLQVTIKPASEGGLDLAAEDLVRIGRTTDVDALARTYQDGSVLKASDMNTQNNQFLYTIQEALDTGTGALPIETDGNYNAGNRRIKNVGSPVNDNDAVTLGVATAILNHGAAVEPQAWTFTADADSLAANLADPPVANADRTFLITDPVPNAAVDNMYLVEVQGVMQAPATDYTVTELGESYTLRLIGAGTAGSGEIPDGTEIVVRNFGNSKNVIALPYMAEIASSEESHALRIKGLPAQQGDLINAIADDTSELFRVDPTGQVIVGAGDVPTTTRASMSTTTIQVGEIDTVTNDTPDAYGVKLSTSSNSGLIEIEGANPDSTEKAIHVDDWDSSGDHFAAFTVTYGGAITALGAADVQGLTTTTLTTTGAATIGGDVSVTDGKSVSIGSGRVQLINDGLNGCKRIQLNNFSTSEDGDSGIISTTTPGAYILSETTGHPLIGKGGDGGSVSYGGAGSIYFDDSGSRKAGPQVSVTDTGVQVGGFKIPTTQGGESGIIGGSNPAMFKLANDSRDLAWSAVNDNEVPCKKQLDAEIDTQANTLHEVYIMGFRKDALTGTSWTDVPISEYWSDGTISGGNLEPEGKAACTLNEDNVWRKQIGSYAHGGAASYSTSTDTLTLTAGLWELTYQFRVARNASSNSSHDAYVRRIINGVVETITVDTGYNSSGAVVANGGGVYVDKTYTYIREQADARTTNYTLKFQLRHSDGTTAGSTSFAGCHVIARRLS